MLLSVPSIYQENFVNGPKILHPQLMRGFKQTLIYVNHLNPLNFPCFSILSQKDSKTTES